MPSFKEQGNNRKITMFGEETKIDINDPREGNDKFPDRFSFCLRIKALFPKLQSKIVDWELGKRMAKTPRKDT